MNSTKLLVVFFLVILSILIDSIHSAQILFLYPIVSKSETHVFLPLVKALAQRNHSVVIVTPVYTDKLDPRIRQIIPTTPLVELDFYSNLETARELYKNKLTYLHHLNKTAIIEKCHFIYQNKEVQDLISDSDHTHKFDLVILSGMGNTCVEGIIHKIGSSPFILMNSIQTPILITATTGWHLPTSVVPAPTLFTDQMSFVERCTNTIVVWIFSLVYHWHLGAKCTEIYRHYLGIDIPANGEIERNVSMIFSNSHPAISFPQPLPPEIIEIGGIHCREPQPLSQDIQEFIDGAEHGVIYFSLGTMTQYKNLPKDADTIFFNVLSRLKQKIIWQRDEEEQTGLALALRSKFFFRKWLPQQDILGHANTRLFISHGGLLGIFEAAYHAKPLIGIPLFLDHDINVQMAKNKGFAIQLELMDLTEDIFEEAIHELLNNSSYTANVKRVSQILKDQQNAPLGSAVFWTEYVLRHKGAHHFRSPARHLNYFQYHSLDVICTIAFVSAVFVLMTYFILKNIYHHVGSRLINCAVKLNGENKIKIL